MYSIEERILRTPMHSSKMKWQIISLVASLLFLVVISHYPYKRNSNGELKDQQKIMPSTNLISLNFELKPDPSSNLNVSNDMTTVSEGNQNIAAIISASICLTFKITTGFIFYMSIFYRTCQTLACINFQKDPSKNLQSLLINRQTLHIFKVFLENILLLKNNYFRSIFKAFLSAPMP